MQTKRTHVQHPSTTYTARVLPSSTRKHVTNPSQALIACRYTVSEQRTPGNSPTILAHLYPIHAIGRPDNDVVMLIHTGEKLVQVRACELFRTLCSRTYNPRGKVPSQPIQLLQSLLKADTSVRVCMRNCVASPHSNSAA